jgi:hypothetical protein
MHIFHKWSKWIKVGKVTYTHIHQTYDVLQRECIICGMIRKHEVYH